MQKMKENKEHSEELKERGTTTFIKLDAKNANNELTILLSFACSQRTRIQR